MLLPSKRSRTVKKSEEITISFPDNTLQLSLPIERGKIYRTAKESCRIFKYFPDIRWDSKDCPHLPTFDTSRILPENRKGIYLTKAITEDCQTYSRATRTEPTISVLETSLTRWTLESRAESIDAWIEPHLQCGWKILQWKPVKGQKRSSLLTQSLKESLKDIDVIHAISRRNAEKRKIHIDEAKVRSKIYSRQHSLDELQQELLKAKDMETIRLIRYKIKEHLKGR